MKKALITGITGQDGSYLTELLISKGYHVHGIIRRSSTCNVARIDHIDVNSDDSSAPGLSLHYGDLSDSEQISNIIYNINPDEIYHLGAQSQVCISFDTAEYTGNITALGTTRILEAIKRSGKPIKFYQASSSEMFGDSPPPQNEKTPFRPRSPYAIAKLHAYWMTVNYSEGYNAFACNGILFNHESPRRGETFVTRKITKAVAAILAKKQEKLFLGNLDAKRDWGYAPEYVEAMWKIMQLDKPENLVVGTGETHSVKEFVEAAFSYADISFEKHVEINPKWFRPTEPEDLAADAKLATKKIGWAPHVTFKDLVKIMVDADLRKIGLEPIGEGDKILEKFPNRFWKTD